MEEQILNALRVHFPDVQGDVTLETTTGRYNGHILSKDFKKLSFVERQRRVFSILRETLGAETQNISMLFTYTPAEYDSLLQAA